MNSGRESRRRDGHIWFNKPHYGTNAAQCGRRTESYSAAVGRAGGRTTCSRKLGQTDRINNRVSQTDGEGGVSEQRKEGVRHIKTELAWHKEKSWIALRYFVHLRRIGSNVPS